LQRACTMWCCKSCKRWSKSFPLLFFMLTKSPLLTMSFRFPSMVDFGFVELGEGDIWHYYWKSKQCDTKNFIDYRS
jgi:hypothetical protein